MSLEPEYARLHRKFHAQFRELYRMNGGLADWQALQLFNERQIMMSYGYETGRNDVGEHKDLQEAVDKAIESAKQGIPTRIIIAGQSAKIPSLLQKEVEPPDGVHVLQVVRVGDKTRGIYLDRLRESFEGGYVSLDEMNARMDAMLSAETEEDLKLLVRDLPPYKPEKKEEKPPEKASRRSVFIDAAGWLLSMCYLIDGAVTHDTAKVFMSLALALGFALVLVTSVVSRKKSP